MRLTVQQVAYLRRVYRLCGPKRDRCADSREVARSIGATEDERMDLENALAQAGYIEVGSAPGMVGLTDRGRRRALR
jgi:Mn-dependent DtxR family transcriptional regulator